jgi:hypothetical protein
VCAGLVALLGQYAVGEAALAQPSLPAVDPTESPISDTADAEWDTTLYGLDRNQAVRTEAGGQFASNLDYDITENIRYRSQLNVFFALNQLDDPPDVTWENVINLQVNSWLSTDLQFVALYDEDTVRSIQMKEVISVGVTFTLF